MCAQFHETCTCGKSERRFAGLSTSPDEKNAIGSVQNTVLVELKDGCQQHCANSKLQRSVELSLAACVHAFCVLCSESRIIQKKTSVRGASDYPELRTSERETPWVQSEACQEPKRGAQGDAGACEMERQTSQEKNAPIWQLKSNMAPSACHHERGSTRNPSPCSSGAASTVHLYRTE